MLPSTLIKVMWKHYPTEFERRLVAKPTELREFWAGFLNNPKTADWARAHPFLKNKSVGELVCSVPVTLHTDAGPCTKSQSCNTVSWGSLLYGGDERLSKFLICSCLKRDNRGDFPSWNRM